MFLERPVHSVFTNYHLQSRLCLLGSWKKYITKQSSWKLLYIKCWEGMLFIISFDLYNTLQTGITRAVVLQFIHPSCCVTKLFVRKPYTISTDPRYRACDGPKYASHPGSAWWSNEFYRGCLLEQKWLTDSCIPKFTPAWVTGRKSWEPRVYYTFPWAA